MRLYAGVTEDETPSSYYGTVSAVVDWVDLRLGVNGDDRCLYSLAPNLW